MVVHLVCGCASISKAYTSHIRIHLIIGVYLIWACISHMMCISYMITHLMYGRASRIWSCIHTYACIPQRLASHIWLHISYASVHLTSALHLILACISDWRISHILACTSCTGVYLIVSGISDWHISHILACTSSTGVYLTDIL